MKTKGIRIAWAGCALAGAAIFGLSSAYGTSTDTGVAPPSTATTVTTKKVTPPPAAPNEKPDVWSKLPSWDDSAGKQVATPAEGRCDVDLNADGSIGFGDILVILGTWGVCDPVEVLDDQPPARGGPDLGSADPCTADLNRDGEVGFADLLRVISVFGMTCDDLINKP